MINKIKSQDDEVFYKSLFENMLDGFAYCQMIFSPEKEPVDFIYLKVNKNFEKLTGLKNVEGKKVTDLIPGIKSSNPELLEIYGRVALTGRPEKFETFIKPLKLSFLVYVYSLQKNFFVAIFQNITDQKKVEKNFEDSKKAAQNVLEDLSVEKSKVDVLVKDLEKFKLAVDNVADNIVISDAEGIVIYANKAIEKTTGYKPEEAIGKKSGSLWKSPMPSEYYKKLWDTIKLHKKNFISEIQNKRKNGEIYSAIISISPILNKKGEVEFYVAVERDITKERAIDKAKTEFVAVASHALRTPLTAIRGLVSMILDKEYGAINKDLLQPLEDIETSSERLIHLVNDLLNISRIQAGRMKFVISDFSVSTIIKDVVHFLQPISNQKGIKLITTELDDVDIQGDSEKIKEILNDLIGNSLKFTDKGRIIISTKIVDDVVEVRVSDTGIGIKKEDQNKLFGLFQQIESGVGRPIGTGFGLHVSRELILKMGGELWIEKSEVGKGSVFVFSIPRSNSALAKKVKREIKKEAKEHPDQQLTNIVKQNN